MSEKALQGQVALVTGAAKRIGRSIALTLAGAGARVVVNYARSEADARATVEEIKKQGGEAVALAADVSRPAEVTRLVAEAEKQLGPVDILVNNAGIFAAYEWEKITEADWDRFMNTNLKAQFFCAQAVAPGMKRRGRGTIVNLASLGGMKVWPAFIPYCVSKAGVIHLTRLLAKALGPEIKSSSEAGALPITRPNASCNSNAPPIFPTTSRFAAWAISCPKTIARAFSFGMRSRSPRNMKTCPPSHAAAFTISESM